MKLFSLIFVALLFLITSCDNPTVATKKEIGPPWGRWLSPDAEHPDKRLEVKFGDVLYRIPQSYLVGEGANQKVDNYSYMHAYVVASYPDLVPVHKMQEKKIPQYPKIEVIFGGHKDDPYRDNSYSKSENPDRFFELVEQEIRSNCGKVEISRLAKDMYQYTCNTKIGTLYFIPIDFNFKTPTGNKLVINCFDQKAAGVGEQVKYECAIKSRMFKDGRFQTTRIHLNDLSNLLDVYKKTLQLLTSLEASNQQQ